MPREHVTARTAAIIEGVVNVPIVMHDVLPYFMIREMIWLCVELLPARPYKTFIVVNSFHTRCEQLVATLASLSSLTGTSEAMMSTILDHVGFVGEDHDLSRILC